MLGSQCSKEVEIISYFNGEREVEFMNHGVRVVFNCFKIIFYDK
jgi:hypothetical protein